MKLGELAYNLKWFFSGLLDKPLKALEKLWTQKRVRMIVVCSAVLIIAVPLAIFVTAKIVLTVDSKKNTKNYVFSFDPVAPEDFFIPEEPDFLPSVMLEREQKKTWSVEDAAEFWTPPSQFPREFWLEEVSNSIDRLLEPLP
ncbi:MAG: hypothetical protein LBF83_02165 [Spirochaetaceae bacterium]|jgi:hypothetical protein|nr:hypothetical protein [Spirochaetaceae bacterium]